MPSAASSRHALHPLLVHFPVVLFGMSFVFDMLSFRLGPAMVEAARYNLIGGLVAAAVAAAVGVRDYLVILQPGSVARRVGRYHALFNLSAIALFAASLAERWPARGVALTPRTPLVLSALGVVLLGVAGYLGGVMVLNYRIPLRR